MKKKQIIIPCIALLCGILCYSYTKNEKIQKEIAICNIEALSEQETDGSFWEYPDGKAELLTCGATTATHWWGNSTCAYIL